jgi:hypothetical protein|tara:strand:- start:3267 stop:3419 length:153 start_codon:yes stop_codon:yes gene_type:complete
MVKKRKSLEILELLKKDKATDLSKNDNEKREEALNKARLRLEEKNKMKEK